jgi:hypothetical protein
MFIDFYPTPAQVQKPFTRLTERVAMDKDTLLQLQTNWKLDRSKPQIFKHMKEANIEAK